MQILDGKYSHMYGMKGMYDFFFLQATVGRIEKGK